MPSTHPREVGWYDVAQVGYFMIWFLNMIQNLFYFLWTTFQPIIMAARCKAHRPFVIGMLESRVRIPLGARIYAIYFGGGLALYKYNLQNSVLEKCRNHNSLLYWRRRIEFCLKLKWRAFFLLRNPQRKPVSNVAVAAVVICWHISPFSYTGPTFVTITLWSLFTNVGRRHCCILRTVERDFASWALKYEVLLVLCRMMTWLAFSCHRKQNNSNTE